MTYPVLFLDIDGVLNSKEFFYRLRAEGKPARLHYMDREKVAILNGIVAATNCRIVVSSTWRRDTKCRRILRYYGFGGTFCRDWRTDWLRGLDEPDLVRGDEIEDWLRRNGRPPYAIVDDDADMLPDQMPRFVQTSFEDGLTDWHAGRLDRSALQSLLPASAALTTRLEAYAAGPLGWTTSRPYAPRRH